MRKTLGDKFAAIISDVANSGGPTTSVRNAHDFITNKSYGLGMNLYPGQSVILKAHYGIALDAVTTFEIFDWKGDPIGTYTEEDLLKYWFDEGRANIREIEVGKELTTMMLSLGRRSGKTLLSACIVAYETYRLIKKGNPQKYYGVTQGDQIQLASLATSREQAKLLFNGVTSHLNNCAFFRPYMANDTQQMVKMQTPRDIEVYGRYADNEKAKSSIKVTFLSSNAAGIRGSGNVVCILDEVAFFPDTGPGGAEEVYQAMGPSLAAYSQKDPNDPNISLGEGEARMIMISSPAGKQGLFYRKFRQAMEKKPGSEHMLAIQAPTWEVNTTVPVSIYKEKRGEDPRAFNQEFGSVFSDETLGFLESQADFLACINPMKRKRLRGQPRVQYFIGSDLAQVNDATAIAIVHIEGNLIVVDFVGAIQAGYGRFENESRLEVEDITNWIHGFYNRFLIQQGVGDQWSAAAFQGPFERAGMKNFEFKKWSSVDTTDMWKRFKSLMYDEKLVLYDINEEDRSRRVENEEEVPAHEDYILEILSLQQKQKTKNTFEVAARSGQHDDQADALARAVWLASEQIGTQKHIVGLSSNGMSHDTLRQRAAVRAQGLRRASRKARYGGSHPSRMIMPQRKGPFG